MEYFVIIEVEDGFEIVEVLPDQSADDAAAEAGGVLIDPGPYGSYDDASDALDQFELAVEEDRE